MTVIAWDGKTLAADKQATNSGSMRTVKKIFKVRGYLVAVAGDYTDSLMLLDWFKKGAIIKNYPVFDEKTRDGVSLLVIDKNKQVTRYETQPIPYIIEDKLVAAGCGRDYAMAAMYCGKTAKQAVEITCKLDAFCGMGVDILEFK